MTTPDNSLSEQPGSPSEVPQASAQQPTGDTPVSDLSAEQLLQLISGETPEEFSGIGQPQEALKAGEQPAASPLEHPATETPAKPPGRLSVRALPADQQFEMAQALEMVREKEASDIFEALQRIRGVAVQTKAEAPTQEPPTENSEKPQRQTHNPPQETDDVTAIESTLADLRAQRMTAKKDFDADLEEQLTIEIEDTLMELQSAKIRRTQDQVAQETYQSQYLSAVDELEAKYPDTLNDESEFSNLLDDLMTAARVRKDPGIADPRFILTKAAQVARMLAPKTSGKPPSPAPAVPRPTGAAIAPAHAGVNRPTLDQIQEMINNADPDELLAAISQ